MNLLCLLQWLNIPLEAAFSILLIQFPIMLYSPWQRHHFAQAIAILNTFGCNIFEKFSRKVMWHSLHVSLLISIYYILCHCRCKPKLFFICFFRTTNACWIWSETSFWRPTWLITFAFSRTCRKWLMVRLSSSVCTATSLLLLYAHNPEQQREAWFRCLVQSSNNNFIFP